MNHTHLLTKTLLVTACLSLATPTHAFLDKIIGSGGTETEDTSKPSGEEYKGVKHAIGVKDFTNDAGWSGKWSLGENLGVMLESALYDSGRFVVVSREKLSAVQDEQKLADGGGAAKSELAKKNMIRPAKYIATGSIVTVESDTQGSSGGISFKGISVGGGGKKSTITAIITLIDTTTGEIVAKERITGKAGGRSLKLGLNRGGLGTSVGGFAKEPIGEAAQDVISKAVDLMIEKMKDEKLDGAVVTVSGKKVYINRGEAFGVQPGQTFLVQTKGEVLLDPTTGEVLDRMEGETVCTLKVDKVKEKIAICSIVEGDKPERGAMVVME